MSLAHTTRHGSLALVLALTAPLAASAAPVPGTPIALPGGVTLEKVDFERHVMGLFGRTGCNNGSCHGSFQGKGGFRLSLFGYDPEKDYQALTREAGGRRLDLADPDHSLLLLKATGQTKHEGLCRFGKNSWEYQVFRAWIVQGAKWEAGSGAVASIALDPPEYAFSKPGLKGQLRVIATFKDGSKENITPFCDFRTNDDAVAEVTRDGQVRGIRAGDTAIVVSYRGNVLPVRVLVPYEAPQGFKYPQVPESNYIDREVFAKLKRLNIVPSELSGDLEFLRRVYIDTVGTLPTPEEVRAFLADRSPNKREKKIDELLAQPLHAALWATKFCDITGNNTDALEQPVQLRPKRSQMWHDWFRKRVQENRPYDEIVKGVLTATSREGKSAEEYIKECTKLDEETAKGFQTSYAERPTLDLFWRRQQQVTIDVWGEKTAAAFLGVRLECAQCHKHPFDRWTQADYRAYANIFAPVSFGISPEAKKAIDAENAARRSKAQGKNNNQIIQVREVFLGAPRGTLPHPDTNAPLPPKTLGGPEIPKDAKDPRVALFEWMHAQDNPFFARSFVNRIWGHYFGRGIVDPVDDFSLANPPSNGKLLDALARDFVAGKYDIRRMEKTILMSRTYQLSAKVNETNQHDRTNYSHAFIRPMMAEVVVDVLNDALGTKETFGNDAPPNCRAVEVAVSRLQNAAVGYIFRIFGRPPRTTACDCERAMEPALPQKLYLMADAGLQRKLTEPGNRIAKVLAKHKDDNAALDELFLASVTRLPTEKERKLFAEYRKTRPDRQAAFADALWALVNTQEFIFNH